MAVRPSGRVELIAPPNRLHAVPFFDYRWSLDGLDPRPELQIEGGLTPRSARALAALLASGVLPVRLTPSRPD
jgi:preprotein translocase subunit SecD